MNSNKVLNYLFLDGSSLLHMFNLNKEGGVISFIERFEKFIDFSRMTETFDLFFFMPPLKNSRLQQYIELANQELSFLQKENPTYQSLFKFDKESFNKISNSLLNDSSKKIYKTIYSLQNTSHEQSQMNYNDLNLHELFTTIKNCFSQINSIRIIGGNGKSNHAVMNFNSDDIIYSSVSYMKDFCQSKEIDLNINLLTNNRLLSLSQILFNDDNHFSFKYYRMTNKEFETYDNHVILNYLTGIYDFNFSEGLLGDYLLKILHNLKSKDNHLELFKTLEYYLKMIEIIDGGFVYNKDNKKQKLVIDNVGIKKINSLCINHISPKHLYSIYNDLKDNDKYKKMILKEQINILNELININSFHLIEKEMIADFLKK